MLLQSTDHLQTGAVADVRQACIAMSAEVALQNQAINAGSQLFDQLFLRVEPERLRLAQDGNLDVQIRQFCLGEFVETPVIERRRVSVFGDGGHQRERGFQRPHAAAQLLASTQRDKHRFERAQAQRVLVRADGDGFTKAKSMFNRTHRQPAQDRFVLLGQGQF